LTDIKLLLRDDAKFWHARDMAGTDQDHAVLQAIMDAAVDAIVVSDASGMIMRANPAAARLFGHDIKDMYGKNVKILMPDAMARQHDGFMTRHIETGENRIIGSGREVTGLRSDGTEFPLHLSVGETIVNSQHVFIGILHDLTQRHATQKALARSQRLDAIGQMTAGIAHDFNNLLTTIIGNLELLEMQHKDPKQLAMIRDAQEAAEIGAELISRLKIFARRSNIAPEVTDLRDVCQATISIISRTLGASYEIKTAFPAKVSLVKVDPVQLQTSLINLALNARDAMPDGGQLQFAVDDVTIDDSYLAQEVGVVLGNYVRIIVSDTGVGMTEMAQRHAFEPFFTTKREGAGTGLGLAMVYGFVRQSGGHITLYSEPGMGSSFGLYFPVTQEQNDDDEEAEITNSNAADAEIGHGQVVLVVEDNPSLRRVTVKRMTDLGFTVIVAENGDAGYVVLKSGTHVDLLFSDIVMPGNLNGHTLAQKVMIEFPKVKVLLTSGYASDALSRELHDTPEHHILHKPYRQADLVRWIKNVMSGAAG
jgi:PAS domain S-box-containing protein